jgi:hypothetical protein
MRYVTVSIFFESVGLKVFPYCNAYRVLAGAT